MGVSGDPCGRTGGGHQDEVGAQHADFVSSAAAAEAEKLAEASGLSIQALANVVRHSGALMGGAAAIMLRKTTAPMEPDDVRRSLLEHTCKLGEKDLSLALGLGDAVSVDLPLAKLALQWLAIDLGCRTLTAVSPSTTNPRRQQEMPMDELRRKGLDKMNQVYAWDMPDMAGEFLP